MLLFILLWGVVKVGAFRETPLLDRGSAGARMTAWIEVYLPSMQPERL